MMRRPFSSKTFDRIKLKVRRKERSWETEYSFL
jgi:hypothetical protein